MWSDFSEIAIWQLNAHAFHRENAHQLDAEKQLKYCEWGETKLNGANCLGYVSVLISRGLLLFCVRAQSWSIIAAVYLKMSFVSFVYCWLSNQRNHEFTQSTRHFSLKWKHWRGISWKNNFYWKKQHYKTDGKYTLHLHKASIRGISKLLKRKNQRTQRSNEKESKMLIDCMY